MLVLYYWNKSHYLLLTPATMFPPNNFGLEGKKYSYKLKLYTPQKTPFRNNIFVLKSTNIEQLVQIVHKDVRYVHEKGRQKEWYGHGIKIKENY